LGPAFLPLLEVTVGIMCRAGSYCCWISEILEMMPSTSISCMEIRRNLLEPKQMNEGGV